MLKTSTHSYLTTQSDALINSYCQVLGTGDDGSNPCVLVSVERKPKFGGGDATSNTVLQRYLFNVGEGTQRFCVEHGVKLPRLSKLFLTGTGPEEHAGLAGLLLSLSALGLKDLEVFGPTGVEHLVEGVHCFTNPSSPRVTVSPLSLGADESQCSYVLGDEHMEVRCGVVDPERLSAFDPIEISSNSSSESSGDSSNDGDDGDDSDDNSSDSSEDSDGSSDDSSSGDSSSDSSNDSDDGDDSDDSSSDSSEDSEGSSEGSSEDKGDDNSEPKRQMQDSRDVSLVPKGTKARTNDIATLAGNISPRASGSARRKKARVGSTQPKPTTNKSAAEAIHSHASRVGELDRHSTVDKKHQEVTILDLSACDGRQENAGDQRGGWNAAGAREEEAKSRLRTGIPAHGPIVVYHCRIPYGGGSTFLVLSCPNIGVHFVIHLSPEDVVRHQRYSPLLGLKGKHITVGCGRREREIMAGGLQHRRVAERSIKLNFVAPQAFPLHSALLHLDSAAKLADGFALRKIGERACVMGFPLLKAVFLPAASRGIDYSAVLPPIDVASIREEIRQRVEDEGLESELELMRSERTNGQQATDWFFKEVTGEIQPASLAGGTSPDPNGETRTSTESVQCKRMRIGPDRTSRVPVVPAPNPSPGAPVRAANAGASSLQRLPLFSGGGLAGAELFFLGTGSAAPTKNRGCSGIYLRIPHSGLAPAGTGTGEPLRILMDAGEGTLGYLERQFGREGGRNEIASLDLVWVSHKHADHHSGVFRVIVERHRAASSKVPEGHEAKEAPLVVVAPSKVLESIRAFVTASGEEVKYRGINCSALVRGKRWNGGNIHPTTELSGNRTRFEATTILSGISAVPVIHCHESYALVLQPWRGGAKLVYSGDTRPCDRLVRSGVNAEILIHEATFDDSEQEKATSKRHSTTSEALDIGRRMGARHIILTHFSQRYPRVPILQPDHSQRYCVAFDGMVLNRETVEVLPKAAGVLSTILEPKADDEAEDVLEIVLD